MENQIHNLSESRDAIRYHTVEKSPPAAILNHYYHDKLQNKIGFCHICLLTQVCQYLHRKWVKNQP